ncbi:hypothetical protein C8F01DRAFT_669944 [Mycena amicta]|nr:hypothetical protein C8F01DRAFT_669944 [Mycena amicta]
MSTSTSTYQYPPNSPSLELRRVLTRFDGRGLNLDNTQEYDCSETPRPRLQFPIGRPIATPFPPPCTTLRSRSCMFTAGKGTHSKRNFNPIWRLSGTKRAGENFEAVSSVNSPGNFICRYSYLFAFSLQICMKLSRESFPACFRCKLGKHSCLCGGYMKLLRTILRWLLFCQCCSISTQVPSQRCLHNCHVLRHCAEMPKEQRGGLI